MLPFFVQVEIFFDMGVGIHVGFGVHTLVWIGQRFLDDNIYNLF